MLPPPLSNYWGLPPPPPRPPPPSSYAFKGRPLLGKVSSYGKLNWKSQNLFFFVERMKTKNLAMESIGPEKGWFMEQHVVTHILEPSQRDFSKVRGRARGMLFLVWVDCCFTSTVSSYGHVGTVS